MAPLQPLTIYNIIERLNRGESSRQIASAVGVGKTTVNALAQRVEIATPRPKAGQPRKLSPRDRREAARLITSGRAESAVQVTRMLNQTLTKKVSTTTVRDALREHNLVTRRRNRKPVLSAKHRKDLLETGQSTIGRVIWSNKTKINRVGSDDQNYARAPRQPRGKLKVNL